MEINEAPHQPCLTELSEDRENEPVTQTIVLKAKKKKKKIQEAQIWTGFTEEASSFQDGQVSLTIANNNNILTLHLHDITINIYLCSFTYL